MYLPEIESGGRSCNPPFNHTCKHRPKTLLEIYFRSRNSSALDKFYGSSIDKNRPFLWYDDPRVLRTFCKQIACFVTEIVIAESTSLQCVDHGLIV